MRARVAAFALAALAVWAASTVAAPASDCAYSYFDDFSTNAVENDSYLHSPVVTSLYSGAYTFLMFCVDSNGNRALGFFMSSWAYGLPPPYLSYRFPSSGGAGGTAGRLDLDLVPAVAGGGSGFGSAEVGIYYDDVVASIERFYGPTHYSVELAPSPSASYVYLHIRGVTFAVDNLSVCLDVTVPTRSTTWGRIKSIYR
jgi:hypothetical protein